MTITELHHMIVTIYTMHPNAKVDFVHPYRRGQKITTRLSNITGYKAMDIERQSGGIVRFVIDHARDEDLEQQP